MSLIRITTILLILFLVLSIPFSGAETSDKNASDNKKPEPQPTLQPVPISAPSPTAAPQQAHTPAPQLTSTPKLTPTPKPTLQPTPTSIPSPIPSPSPTPTSSPTPESTLTPKPTLQLSPTPVPQPVTTPLPSPTPQATPTQTPDPPPITTLLPTSTPQPTLQPTPQETSTQTPTPAPSPTPQPTPQPTSTPPPEYIPPAPVDLASTQGNFWINHTWKAGDGAVTDSYNVNIDGTWKNGTTSTYYNASAKPHGGSAISVWAYNNSGGGSLSLAPASQSVQVPNNPISISGIKESYQIVEGQTLDISASYSDADGDKGVFSDNSEKWDVDPSSGTVKWATHNGDDGTYEWHINISDGYGSVATKSFTAIVSDSTPGAPSGLTGQTGNFWINFTWERGANTDSFNVSFNGTWVNGSIDTFINRSVGPHGQGDVTVYGWNNTLGALGPGISQSLQVPNNPPVQPQIGDREIYKGQLLTFSINATDADSDPVNYGTNANKGNLDSSTGIYMWTPEDSDEGVYTWEFSSKDGYGGAASETIKVTVKNPLELDLGFIEPDITSDNATRTETWRDASEAHAGKLIGYSSNFRNTGNYPMIITVTEFYNNKSRDNNSFSVTLAENESKTCQDNISRCRLAFEVDPAGVRDGFFNFTLQMSVRGHSGSDFIYNYTNITTISLPVTPVYRMKRANGALVVVSEGRTTTVTYTLEANSSVNLTDVSIYDPLYPEGFFNITSLEANNPQRISFNYPATTADISKYKCDEAYGPCILNLATLTAKTESGEVIRDTDYVRLKLCRNTDKDCLAGISSQADSSGRSGGSGGGGGGGGGIPPSEDFKNIERREVREMDILSRVSSVYVLKASDPVMVVAFESSVSENEVPVAVEVLKNRSKGIKNEALGRPYRYFNIFVGTSGFSRKVSNGVVAFRINNSWLEENNLNPEDISLYKWQGGWIRKETEIAERKPNHTYYASLVGNFSSFAIAAVKKPKLAPPESNVSMPLNMTKENSSQIMADANVSKAKQLGGIVGLPAAFALVLGVVGIVYYLRRKRKIELRRSGKWK